MAEATKNEAGGAEITVLCTNAAREALMELKPMFERISAHRLNVVYGGGPGMLTRIRAGEVADLFIGPRDFSDPLLAEGRLVPGSRVDFAHSFTGVAVRKGAPRPDIGSASAFSQALLAARSVAYSGGASGLQFVSILQRLGIADAVKAKRVTPQPGELVGAVLERDAAEIGVQQMSELLPFSGIDILGPLPAELQEDIIYGASLLAGSAKQEAAREFVNFLRSDAAAPVITEKGMRPV